jgi:hypothetical protein
VTGVGPVPGRPAGRRLPGGRRSPRRRALLRVAAAVIVLVVTATVWSTVARAEKERTERQIATVHDLLRGDDYTMYEQRPGPESWLSMFRPNVGRWGWFATSRSVDDLLRGIRSAAGAASLDEPYCVSPEQAERDDGTVVVRIREFVHACDLTFGGQPFGSVELDPFEEFDTTYVTFGIGPDAEIMYLREQVEHESDEPWTPEPVGVISAADVVRGSVRADVVLAFVVAVGSSTAASGVFVLVRRGRGAGTTTAGS